MKATAKEFSVEKLLRGFHLTTMAVLYEPTMLRAESEAGATAKRSNISARARRTNAINAA